MSVPEFKSGSEIIGEFLASKKDDKKIDQQTLASVQELFDSKKLTKVQLLRALERNRTSDDLG